MEFFKRKKKVDTSKDDTAEEVTFEEVKEEPNLTIGEKVVFWQEQDQLNREIVPRVIKNHEEVQSLKDKVLGFEKELKAMKDQVKDDDHQHEDYLSTLEEQGKNIQRLETSNKVLLVLVVLAILSRFVVV